MQHERTTRSDISPSEYFCDLFGENKSVPQPRWTSTLQYYIYQQVKTLNLRNCCDLRTKQQNHVLFAAFVLNDIMNGKIIGCVRRNAILVGLNGD